MKSSKPPPHGSICKVVVRWVKKLTIHMISNKKTTSGQFQRKRGDTLIRTIEKNYSVKFNGARGDMKLSTYLKKEGLPSLSKALNKVSR